MRIRAVVCSLVLLAVVQAGPDETKEPPQILTLEVEGGRTIPVRIGKPFTVEIGGRKTTMKLTASPHRVFAAAGIRFHYPRRFTFEHEKGDGLTTWTFEGPNTVLMIQRYEAQDAAALLKDVEATVAQLHGKKMVGSETSLSVGGRVLKGRRCDLKILGESVRQDYYSFDAGGSTYVLMVQDSMTDDGKPTEEALGVVELLRQSMQLK